MRNSKIYNWGLVALLLIFMSSCIENDIPYPVVRANVLEIEFEGQKSANINTTSRTIEVELDEMTDIRKVKLNKLSFTVGAQISPEVKEFYNLSKELSFTLSTYQQYVWKVVTNQTINRSSNLEGQLGNAIFYDESKTVLITVSEMNGDELRDMAKLKVNGLNFGAASTVSPDPKTVTDFRQPVLFDVTAHGRTETWTVIVQSKNANAVTNPAEDVRARRAILMGSVADLTQVYGFKHRKKGAAEWIVVNGEEVILENGNIKLPISTTEATSYEFCAFQGASDGDVLSFTTDMIPVMPNMSFEEWHIMGGTYRPWKEGEELINPPGSDYQSPFWDTGNEGTSIIPSAGSATVYVEDGFKGRAVKLESKKGLAGIAPLAAGSFFIGDFKTNMGEPLLSPRFGRPFTSRPDKLVGKYKYKPVPIDITGKGSEYAGMKGKMDKGVVWINLEDWGDAKVRPVKVEGGKLIYTGKLIAEGRIEFTEEKNSYTTFEIKLNYKVNNKLPTHIVIAVSSSELGEYYVGGAGSVLHVDEFELVYESISK